MDRLITCICNKQEILSSFYTSHILLLSLNNAVALSSDWHGFSLRKAESSFSRDLTFLFVLPTYVEIIPMRWLHGPIVTKLCQNPWNGF